MSAAMKFKVGDRVKYNIQYLGRTAKGIGTVHRCFQDEPPMYEIETDQKRKIVHPGDKKTHYYNNHELAHENELEYLTLDATSDNASLWDALDSYDE